MTNKDRQLLTEEMTRNARSEVVRRQEAGVLNRGIVIASDSYNQGIIGLVAGRLVEEYYRPTIVIARGEVLSKGSARSISGFNIIDAIREHSMYITESGGHPLAAGFSIETKYIDAFGDAFEAYVSGKLTDDDLQKTLTIDMQIPFSQISLELYRLLRKMEPFGFGNGEPVFSTENLVVIEKKQVGSEGKHLKLKVATSLESPKTIEVIGFSMGSVFGQITKGSTISLAYTISENTWNGKTSVQLKLRDIHL
jgi:single-stranded-DNA-specific exonuclease